MEEILFHHQRQMVELFLYEFSAPKSQELLRVNFLLHACQMDAFAGDALVIRSMRAAIK